MECQDPFQSLDFIRVEFDVFAERIITAALGVGICRAV